MSESESVAAPEIGRVQSFSAGNDVEWVYPKLGTAGLGNELFAFVRAAMIAEDNGATLIAPRWFKLKVRRWLRRDPDPRIYWPLFRPPSWKARWRRLIVEARIQGSRLRREAQPAGVVVVSGMLDYFGSIRRDSAWARTLISRSARNGVIGSRSSKYFSAHVRLGDFARSVGDPTVLASNNTATPLAWYEEHLRAISERFPDIPIVISSDGTDDELAPLLALPNVVRSDSQNPLDEIFILANSIGMLGSRSTFTAWGAYLGAVPLLVMSGGNAYSPHAHVWEVPPSDIPEEWVERVEERLRRSDGSSNGHET